MMINMNTDHPYFYIPMTLCKHRVGYFGDLFIVLTARTILVEKNHDIDNDDWNDDR